MFSDEHYNGREKPFQIQSQGLGLSWALDNKASLEQGKITSRGIPLSIPRYYVKKLDLDLINVSEERASEFDQKWERYWTYKGAKPPEEKLERYYKMIQQDKSNIEGKIRVNGGKL